MFKKPLAHQSNATPIRSSARRALLADIFRQYPWFLPDSKENETPEEIAEREKEIRETGKLILPEGVRSGSIRTSAGVEGTLYLHPESNGAIWMSFGRDSNELIPTLLLLTLPLPGPPLPLIKLHHPIPPPILAGAPLFIGAVRNLHRPWLLPDVTEGGIVAFVAAPGGDDDDSVEYVGVGRLVAKGGMRGALDRRKEALKSERDVSEGVFCEIMNIQGDHLYEASDIWASPVFQMPRPRKPLEVREEPLDEPEAGPSRPRTPTTKLADDLENTMIPEDTTKPGVNESLSASEISTLLNLALHQALSNLSPASFPIPASTFYSAHVLPNRPAYIPKERREEVVIGKSEWKKLAKWMKEASKDGIIKIKESKGEITIVSYDPSNLMVESHKPHQTISEEDTKMAKKAAKEAEVVAAQAKGLINGKKGKELDIQELWKPMGTSAAFWEACGIEKNSLQPASSLKPALDDYLSKNKLYDHSAPRTIKLDENLSKAVGIKPGQNGSGFMDRDEILKKLRNGVAWSVSVGGSAKKGNLQPILLSIKQRQGRKTVTLISGLEAFGIEIENFAEDLKKLCAGSTSIQPLTGASPKLNLKEIMVQGTQTKIVTESLMGMGVPRRWIKEESGKK